ncbi:pickpocket protein 28-like [Photinus pyralis]|nr:pickpocket protein 28-like [Photinus pyralis]
MSKREPTVLTVTGILDSYAKEKSQLKENQPVKNLQLHFTTYCAASSIHGVRYIGERGRHIFERALWAVIVTALFTCCLVMIRQAYAKWEISPVTVTFATTETPIHTIPFPAVTFCPEAKFDPEKFNFTKTYLRQQFGSRLTKLELTYVQFSYLVCSSATQNHDLFEVRDLNDTIPVDICESLLDVTPEFDPLSVTYLNWIGHSLESGSALIPTFTAEGLCYTFNMLPYEEILRFNDPLKNSSQSANKPHKWSLEDGYPQEDALDAFPRRTFISGIEGGLRINSIYTNSSHLDHLCTESLQGFKVSLHHPCELPSMNKYFRLPLDQAVFVGIKPSMITVSPELRDYPAETRKCYFAQEKYLASYKVYTQQNCLDECLANHTWKHCDCIPFYLAVYGDDTKICGPAKFRCVQRCKTRFAGVGNSTSAKRPCNCWPACTSLTYDVEISQTDWSWSEEFGVWRQLNDRQLNITPHNTHLSMLSVYYKELQFLNCERKELYGTVEFFSNTGGLLGLFIGFSIVSAAELVYFLTVRIICNIIMYGTRTWAGHQG